MVRRALLLLSILLPAAAIDPPALGAEEAPSTAVVRKAPLAETVEVEGTLVPVRHRTVAFEPERYGGPLEIVEVAPEGRVVEGQPLVRFDDEEIRRQIEAQERKVAEARLKLQRIQAEHALRAAERAHALDKAKVDRRRAQEAVDRFTSVERALLEAEKIHAFEGHRIRLQNMREELAQLEKMYTEDDLTEETEEIVLKRNRRSFERMLESFERTKKRHEYDMEVDLPRREEKLWLDQQRTELALERLRTITPLQEEQEKLEHAQARRALDEAHRALEELRGDRERLVLRAPLAGWAVHGHLEDGAWKHLAASGDLAPGETVKAGAVLCTVVDESDLVLRTSVGEQDVLGLEVGMPATVTVKATGERRFEAKVARVARYGRKGRHEVLLRLVGEADPALRAGLHGTGEVPKAAGPDVLSLPQHAVYRLEDGTWIVFIAGAAGPVRKAVQVGRRAAGRVVVEGLEAGQRVLADAKAQVEADANEQADGDRDGDR